ncbi:MAG: alpha/beta hydrolase [Thermoplasmatota archaeon]
MRRALGYSVAILAVTAATAVAWVATVDFELPQPSGEHAVGRLEGEFGDARRVAFILYYPGIPGTGHAGQYMPPAIADPVAQRDLGPFAKVDDPWSRVHHPARDDALWADGRFPLIVFSPGADVQPQYYSSLLVELASHGYVVAALSHPGLTPFIAYSDGAIAANGDPPRPTSPEDAMRQHEGRIADVTADIRAAKQSLGTTFASHLDGRVASFGHSLGGAAAVQAAVQDEGFLVAGDLDGSLGQLARHVALDRPVFFMTDGGPVAPEDQAARTAFVHGGEPGLEVTLHGASHMSFATDTNFFEEAVPFQDSDSLAARETFHDVATPLVQFFQGSLPSR